MNGSACVSRAGRRNWVRAVILVASLSALAVGGAPVTPKLSVAATERVQFYTSAWTGERLPDGRPKVPDNILQRMKNISIEDAWAVLRNEGYRNQFEGGWQILHQDVPVVGRALTAQYMPTRPDVKKMIDDGGKAEGRIGGSNSWPIDMLQKGDVYVADGMGKIVDGTLIGDNLGNSIFAKSGNGVVFDGSVRDIEGLAEIQGFNAFVRGWDPSFIQEVMLTGINAKREGALFIPAHLAERVVRTGEATVLRDRFGHQRLKEGKYTPGQIDGRWSEEIRNDFGKWLEQNMNDLPVPKEAIQEMLQKRSW
jgi:4-hydroxy-4-methyl-2-oxoglutarate aldolase